MEQNRYKNLSDNDGELTTTTNIIITPLKCPICGMTNTPLDHYAKRHHVCLEVKTINY